MATLVYVAPDRRIMLADVTNNTTFPIGEPRLPFKRSEMEAADITADGRRILTLLPLAQGAQGSLTVVLNWTADLNK